MFEKIGKTSIRVLFITYHADVIVCIKDLQAQFSQVVINRFDSL